ncbi:DNA-directed DNA polymerase IV [Saccharomycopsis crataegensis]|uniref:DNA polymerase n=1 Tax=Saccharomycopsis crataegensis TaxID=43959 RepID=A0AAV5QMU5_9ASCO|nr:DNA-directed DNA polymerase IV [Saccharomycopsis crataegensis]
MFKELVFLTIPKNSSKGIIAHKRKVFDIHGAQMKNSLTERNVDKITHILIDYQQLNSIRAIITSLKLEELYNKNFKPDATAFKAEIIDKLIKVPFIKESWFNDSIETGKVLSLTAYQIPEVHQELLNEFENFTKDGKSRSPTKKRKKSVSLSPSEQPTKKQYLDQDDKNTGRLAEQERKALKRDSRREKIKLWIRTSLNDRLLEPSKVKNNPNLPVIKALSEFQALYDGLGDDFRVRGYIQAINSLLLEHNNPIVTYQQAIKLRAVGQKIARKIAEFAKTGKIAQLDTLKQDQQVQIIVGLTNIFGVGPAIARNWYEAYHITSMDDVKAKAKNGTIKLTKEQRLGIEYYDDWNQSIEREMIDLHYEMMKEVCKEVDPSLDVHIMGSYRRGLSRSHDIDFFLTSPNYKTKHQLVNSGVAKKLMGKLNAIGYLQCELSGSDTKFLSGAKLVDYNDRVKKFLESRKSAGELTEKFGDEKRICRRVDFLFVQYNELGAALLYFTGNDIFNRMVRFLARLEGYKLSNHGLFDRSALTIPVGSEPRNNSRAKNSNYQENDSFFDESDDDDDIEVSPQGLIESFDEKRILDLLGVVWHTPMERNIGEFKRLDFTKK